MVLVALPASSLAADPAASPWPLLAGAVVFGAALALAAIALAGSLAARRARQSEAGRTAEMEAWLAAAADLLWETDGAGIIRALHAPGGRPLPPLAASWTGRALWQLGHKDGECPAALRRALDTRAPIDGLLIELGDGESRHPWLLAGRPHGAGHAGIARDLSPLLQQLADARGSTAQAQEITRLQGEIADARAEADERSRQHALATRELESFAHSVSHDLRAPLRVVDGFATILLEDYAQPAKVVDELGQEHIRRIIGAGQRMNAMIDTLLAMSRMTSRDLEPERVNLSQMARELADELKAGDRSRRVEFSIAPDLVTEGDRTLLRLVLQNLIGNAFKFTGRVAVAQIEVAAGTDDSGRRVYRVRDNGAGFDPRFADKMFGLFQRFHSANEFPGTGVGLATVQRIVRKHGGRIWAESQPGEGATFYFTLWESR
jgi:signal transduction histidine kinase